MSFSSDKLLENRRCDICHKFLSVMPVKVYPQKITKCGLCSQSDDDGVVDTQYELLAKQGMFKCVNRFEGCRELLHYTQVVDHESTCHGKTHSCPVCLETTNIPTFLLIKHFNERHKEYLLETSSFREELTTSCTKTYLYRINDNLFFIELINTRVDVIGLKAHYLGDQRMAEKVTQKFIVYYGDDPRRFETETKTCALNSEGFLFDMPKKQANFVFVTFHIDLERLDTDLALATDPKMNIGFPRTISLGALHDPNISLNSSSTSLLLRFPGRDQSKCVMYCINCSRIGSSIWSFVEVKPKVYQLICDLCKIYFQRKMPNFQIVPETVIFPEEWFPEEFHPNITYACIWQPWGCLASHEDFSSLYNHEVECVHQPNRRCLVSDCTYEGKLIGLKEHFRCSHPAHSIRFNPVDTFYIIMPLPKCYYMWAYHGFIPIEVSSKGSSYQISLLQADNEDTAKPQPRVLICDNEKFLTVLTDDIPVYTSSARNIKIRWFFEC